MRPDRTARVCAELRGRRLLAALVALLLVPAVLAALALSYQRPDAPPGPSAYDPMPLPVDPGLVALQEGEVARSILAERIGRELTQVALVEPSRLAPAPSEPAPSELPTVVLAPRQAPYTLAEVTQQVPQAFGSVGGALLVRADLEVPTGAHLVLDTATPDVRLLSTPAAFATLVSRGGTITVAGSDAQRVRVSSWDEARGAPDVDVSDGRSFLLVVGGRMDVDRALVEHLGFGPGTSSGAAWRGAPGAPARGEVTRSVFTRNWFGAYTFEAQGMRWAENTFADNAAYGFDPHDLSSDFVVERNVARGNGRHGFIFSRGCDRNVLRDNVAHDNRGHGFMIDDGRSVAAANAPVRMLTSDDNVVERNHAYDNDGSGIEVEGGTGNVVRDNLVERNHVGVRVKDGASVEVVGNTIVDSRLYGVDVMSTAARALVTGNTITGGWAGIGVGEAGGAAFADNTTSGVTAPLVVEGVGVRESTALAEVGRFLRWNPVLVLWGLILGVPLLVQAARSGPVRLVARRDRRLQARA